jgi:hypothetical protein
MKLKSDSCLSVKCFSKQTMNYSFHLKYFLLWGAYLLKYKDKLFMFMQYCVCNILCSNTLNNEVIPAINEHQVPWDMQSWRVYIGKVCLLSTPFKYSFWYSVVKLPNKEVLLWPADKGWFGKCPFEKNHALQTSDLHEMYEQPVVTCLCIFEHPAMIMNVAVLLPFEVWTKFSD